MTRMACVAGGGGVSGEPVVIITESCAGGGRGWCYQEEPPDCGRWRQQPDSWLPPRHRSRLERRPSTV